MRKKTKERNYKYFFVSFFLLSLLVPLVDATSLGTFKQGRSVSLKQVCDNCTYVNLTEVQKPDSTFSRVGVLMTKTGAYYNYTYGDTSQIGTYYYTACGNPDGIFTCETADFDINPSGYANQLGYTIVIILIIYSIAGFGFFGKNEWVAIIGGMGLILLGLYTLNNGIDVSRNFMTESFSYITIGLGSFISIFTGLEMVRENL